MAQVNIAQYARRVSADLDEAARAIKLSLFKGVILDTRWDTGRLRGNWQTSTGSPEKSETERTDPNGSAAIDEALQNITSDGIDYMTNNLPYAAVYEEKDAMIARNLLRVKNNILKAAK
jgi:hypothetical protein